MKLTGAAILVSRGMEVLQAAPASLHVRSVFSNASLHPRITNAFSDISRPRRCTLAGLGAIDLRAQTQIPSVLISDTPTTIWLSALRSPV